MYKKDFDEALDRTKRFGLDIPKFKYMSGSILSNELMMELSVLTNKLAIEDLAAKCISINHTMRGDIEKIFNVPCLYTIGYIQLPSNDKIFYQSEEMLSQMLKDVIYTPREINIHAWITLPTMEIIDISLPTTLQVANNIKPERHIYANEADQFKGHKYVPMLVGDDFLKKSGMGVMLGDIFVT